jgi:hypothetical protein
MPDRSGEQIGGTNPDYHRQLPDPDICEAKPIGQINSFAMCMVEYPLTCKYVMGYGNGYLCRHPNWRGFVKQS